LRIGALETEETFKGQSAIRVSQEGNAMPSFLDFEHSVQGKTPESVFAVIESWLNGEKAHVKESQRPSRIVAAHGRALQPLGWRQDARKTIAFDLESTGPDVLIRVRITPASLNATDVRMRSDEARANWTELLAGLWVRFGETETTTGAIGNRPVDWPASLQRGKARVLAGGVLLAIGAVAIIVLFPSPGTYLGTGLLTAGVVLILYGGMTVQSARARIADQAEEPHG
jgi:hypothetical protein